MQPAPRTTFKDFRLYGGSSELTPPRDVYYADAEILAFRFAGDWISPELRDLTLRTTFDNVRGNGRLEPTCPHAHAVFTTHYRDTPGSSTRAAYDELIAFLNEKLR